MDFEPIIDMLSARVPHSEHEYVDEEGLRRCTVCLARVEKRINLLGKEKVVRCICYCKKEELESDRRKREADARRNRCFDTSNMHAWTFEKDDRSNEKISDAMLRYAEKFDEFKAHGKGLLLFGNVGTGKTYYAACIANHLIDRGLRVKMTNFARMTNHLQGMWEGKNEYIDELCAYPLIIIDDLGAERKSEFMQEMIFNIIDSRYRTGLPFIITTNLTKEQLTKPDDISYARIYDRILERCFPVKVEGESRRIRELKDSHADIKQALGL